MSVKRLFISVKRLFISIRGILTLINLLINRPSCQVLHWRSGHKKDCARLKAKAAEAAEEAAEAEAKKKGRGGKNKKKNAEGGGESRVSQITAVEPS